jgi:hypothetical protein
MRFLTAVFGGLLIAACTGDPAVDDPDGGVPVAEPEVGDEKVDSVRGEKTQARADVARRARDVHAVARQRPGQPVEHHEA